MIGNQPEPVAIGSSGMGTDVTTYIERVEPGSFVAAVASLPIQTVLSELLVLESQKNWRETPFPRKGSVKTELRVQVVWWKHWISEIESAKSIDELKTSRGS